MDHNYLRLERVARDLRITYSAAYNLILTGELMGFWDARFGWFVREDHVAAYRVRLERPNYLSLELVAGELGIGHVAALNLILTGALPAQWVPTLPGWAIREDDLAAYRAGE